MNMNIVNEITARQLRHYIPEFSSGDTIRVYVRIIENKKERNQGNHHTGEEQERS